MSSEAAAAAEPRYTSTGVSNSKLGIWLFLASEVMFFTGLLGGYIVLRLGSESWPDPTKTLGTLLLGINTFVLIVSSVTMVKAVHAAETGDGGKLRQYLLFTALLGCVFLSIKIFDYNHLIHGGFTPGASLFGSVYFLITGFHGVHVLGGVITLLTLIVMSRRGLVPAARSELVECVGLYWHFVDVVWIILFAILCLV